ncbi:MAG TPA: PDZ domain-containing protein, partial [Candidatus Bathyarchaeia archaeon]|nr:PDZ domain-containing protein [Candidatus Bathyarchaeia archaeon]
STTDQYLKKHLGDVIIAVDGHNITKHDDLLNYIGQNKIAGNDITLTLYRNGHAIGLKATLAARPSVLPFLTTRSAPPSVPHPPILSSTIPHPITFPVTIFYMTEHLYYNSNVCTTIIS